MLPRRDADSRKGENGRVLVIGGSLDYSGAPVLSALAALSSGADLVHILVPECNFEVSRSFYPDFIVHKYGGNYLNLRVHDIAAPLLEKVDSVLIGPGLSRHPDVLANVEKLLKHIRIPIVLDADALPAIHSIAPSPHPLVLTPHQGEFAELISENYQHDLPIEAKQKLLLHYAEKWNAVILLKGQIDMIASPQSEHTVRARSERGSGYAGPNEAELTKQSAFFLNETGNSGMTVGGTGDVLSGLVASLIAQKLPPFSAACAAAFICGTAGDELFKHKGYGFSATDVALEIAYTMGALL